MKILFPIVFLNWPSDLVTSKVTLSSIWYILAIVKAKSLIECSTSGTKLISGIGSVLKSYHNISLHKSLAAQNYLIGLPDP